MSGVILSVEDDDSSYMLIQIALDELGQSYALYRAVDGVDGLSFLRREGKYNDAPRPNLVLANINMPKMNGFELLRWMKEDPSLATIPVVMFTSSALDADKARCLALGAKDYLMKPTDLDQFMQSIQSACSLAAPA